MVITLDILAEAWAVIRRADPGLAAVVGRSLQISLGATLCAAVVGLPVAGGLAAAPPRLRRALLPVIRVAALTPAVLVGLLIALLAGRGTGAGTWGVASPWAVGAGQALLGLLVVVSLAEPALRTARRRLLKTAWTLGAGPARVWWTLAGEARAALGAAVVAAFARVVGEAGSALLVGGGSATMAAAIVTHADRQEWGRAMAVGIMLALVGVLAGLLWVRLWDDGD